MAQITITLDLTPETLEILKLLTTASVKKTGDNTPEPKQLSFDDMESEDTGDVGKDKAPVKKSGKKGQKAAAPKETPVEPEADETDDAPEITLTDVRAVALKLSKAGKQKQLKEIFAKYGADKLSEIDAKHYGDLMADLEAANE